jgi:hypothetical protein
MRRRKLVAALVSRRRGASCKRGSPVNDDIIGHIAGTVPAMSGDDLTGFVQDAEHYFGLCRPLRNRGAGGPPWAARNRRGDTLRRWEFITNSEVL